MEQNTMPTNGEFAEAARAALETALSNIAAQPGQKAKAREVVSGLMIRVKITTRPAVIQFADLLAAVKWERDEYPDAPGENDEVYTHERTPAHHIDDYAKPGQGAAEVAAQLREYGYIVEGEEDDQPALKLAELRRQHAENVTAQDMPAYDVLRARRRHKARQAAKNRIKPRQRRRQDTAKARGLWTGKLQENYRDFSDFSAYSNTYALASRLGFDSAESAWNANPLIQCGANPADYRRIG